MAHEVRVPSTWGTVAHPDEDTDERLDVEDGTVTVDDEETARALASTHRDITFDDSEADAESETEDEDEAEEFDADAFVDRTPMGDVVSDIENGEADDNLDAVEDTAEREGVQDAVEARRDELEGE